MLLAAPSRSQPSRCPCWFHTGLQNVHKSDSSLGAFQYDSEFSTHISWLQLNNAMNHARNKAILAVAMKPMRHFISCQRSAHRESGSCNQIPTSKHNQTIRLPKSSTSSELLRKLRHASDRHFIRKCSGEWSDVSRNVHTIKLDG